MTTQLEQDAKNAKTFGIISIAAFVVLHILAVVLSHNAFKLVAANPLLLIVNIAAAVWLVICVKSVFGAKLYFEENNWPYILMLILSFASAVTIGYCPQC